VFPQAAHLTLRRAGLVTRDRTGFKQLDPFPILFPILPTLGHYRRQTKPKSVKHAPSKPTLRRALTQCHVTEHDHQGSMPACLHQTLIQQLSLPLGGLNSGRLGWRGFLSRHEMNLKTIFGGGLCVLSLLLFSTITPIINTFCFLPVCRLLSFTYPSHFPRIFLLTSMLSRNNCITNTEFKFQRWIPLICLNLPSASNRRVL
jgi:hypothetical protein